MMESIQAFFFLLASKVLLKISVFLAFKTAATQLSSLSFLLDTFWHLPSPTDAHLSLPLGQHYQCVLTGSLCWALVRHSQRWVSRIPSLEELPA